MSAASVGTVTGVTSVAGRHEHDMAGRAVAGRDMA